MTKDTIIAVHQIVRESIFTQLRTKERIDTKISVIIGFNSLIFVLSWQLYPNVQNILFFLGVGLLVTSFVLLLKSYGTQDWMTSPNLQALIQELEEGKEIEDIYIQTIGDIGGVPDGAYRLNEKRLHQKSLLFNTSTYIVLLGLILIGISRISFSVFPGVRPPL